MKKIFKLLFFATLFFNSCTSYSGECEKDTSRASIKCLEQKIATLNKRLLDQEEKLHSLVTNRNPSKSSESAEKLITQSHYHISGEKIDNGDYTFQFIQCETTKQKKDIICTFFVTNNSDEHIVGFSTNWVRLFLPAGGSSSASEIYLGNIGGEGDKWDNIEYKFSIPSSVPIRGKAIYKNMSSDSDTVSLFQFKIAPNNNRKKIVAVDFKNLPIISTQ
jgi:hypothetical protein